MGISTMNKGLMDPSNITFVISNQNNSSYTLKKKNSNNVTTQDVDITKELSIRQMVAAMLSGQGYLSCKSI